MDRQYSCDEVWFETDTNNEEDLAKLGDRFYHEVDRVKDVNAERTHKIIYAGALYGDSQVFTGSFGSGLIERVGPAIYHNIIAPAIDTLASEATEEDIRPRAVTVGGDYQLRDQARLLTQYFDAKWDEERVHDIIRAATLDAGIYGLGAIHCYRENPEDPRNDNATAKKVFPGYIFMDDISFGDGLPRELYISQPEDKYYLIKRFPKYKEEIMKADSGNSIIYTHDRTTDRTVEVTYGYHLASTPGASDGFDVIAVRGQVLFFRRHSKRQFPVKFIRCIPPRHGFWGGFLTFRAAPSQIELNRVINRISFSMNNFAIPRVWISRQSQIVKKKITNAIGAVIEHDGPPPQFQTPSAMSTDVYAWTKVLEEFGYKGIGISELSVTSKKPAGLDSAVAQREYNKLQTRRWIHLIRDIETAAEDIAREFMELETEISREYSGHSILSKAKDKTYKDYKWSEINIDLSSVRCRVDNSSALPTSPGGKIQKLLEMVQLGVLSPKDFVRLGDVPDFDAVRRLLTASDDLLESIFNDMLAKGEYVSPEPGMDMEQGRIMATMMAYRAKLDGYPEERIAMLRTWIDESIALEGEIQEAAMEDAAARMQAAGESQGLQQQQPPNMETPAIGDQMMPQT